ncbi:MAG: ABC transporter permease [Planctomycetaceae bacterium]|nr:ABC transporter permease [Planctomycetaceae bacterium]
MSIADFMKRFPWWHEVILGVLLAGLLSVVGVVNPQFLNLKGQLLLSRHLWEFALLALPMTLIILTGGIDLSVGASMGMCAVAFGLCHANTGSLALSCLVCLLIGTAGGAVNGWLVSRMNVHPLIVTLATYATFRGLAEGTSQGESYSQFGDGFSQLARGMWWGVPIPAYLFALMAITCALYLSKTPSGRYIYAIGHNELATRFSGANVDRLKFRLYTFSGFMAGLATIIYVSRFDTAKADAGTGFELDVITAVVVGGTSIYGGRGNIGGTVLGLLLIHETRLFVSRQWQIEELRSIVIGLLLIGSLLLYRVVRPVHRD